MSAREKISIIFGGDFAPVRRFEPMCTDRGESIFGDLRNQILAANLSIVNLECPLTMTSNAIKKIGPNMKAMPACGKSISCFTAASLANNHIYDYGDEGVSDTIENCNAHGVAAFGAASQAGTARQALHRVLNGLKVAVIGLAEHEFNISHNGEVGASKLDPVNAFYQIREACTVADVVLIKLHAGNEGFPYPRPNLRKLCHFMIDIGADAVITDHAHLPGAYEYYSGKPIVYSLGNLLFDRGSWDEEWNSGYLAKLLFCAESGRFIGLDLIPYIQHPEIGGVRLITGRKKTECIEKIEGYRKNMGDKNLWRAEWDKFVRSRSREYILRSMFPVDIRGLGRISQYRLSRILTGTHSSRQRKLNMIRCDSHREILEESLLVDTQGK